MDKQQAIAILKELLDNSYIKIAQSRMSGQDLEYYHGQSHALEDAIVAIRQFDTGTFE